MDKYNGKSFGDAMPSFDYVYSGQKERDNQPIEEKCNWQEEFEKRFRYFFHQPCERCSIAIDGETMRDRIIWTDSLKKEVVSFIENLLEQEKKRLLTDVMNTVFEFEPATAVEILEEKYSSIINK